MKKGDWVFVDNEDQYALVVGIRPRSVQPNYPSVTADVLVLIDDRGDYYDYMELVNTDIASLSDQYDTKERFKSVYDDFIEKFGNPISWEQFAEVYLRSDEVIRLWMSGMKIGVVLEKLHIRNANEYQYYVDNSSSYHR